MSSPNVIISVGVPVFNCADYLQKCVRSIFDQTHRPVQIVLVDDGSTDSSPRMIEELRAECPADMEIVVAALEKSGGVSHARNTVCELATGDYVFFMDSDDWIAPTCFEILLNKAVEHEADVCCGTFEFYNDENNRNVDPVTSGKTRFYPDNGALLRAYCDREIPVFIWNKLIRRSFLVESGLCFEESLKNDEDQLWCFRLVTRVQRWATTADVTYHYRKNNPSSITAKSFTRRRLRNYYSVLRYMNAEIEGELCRDLDRSRLLAKAVYNFARSILWHIELDRAEDFRELYAEFKRNNTSRRAAALLENLHGKDRLIAWTWELPYPLIRWTNPCFFNKLTRRQTG